MKGFTLFSGFEGVGIGMKAVGVEHVGGVEHDPKIAQVAIDNGFDVTIGTVLTVSPSDFPDMDWLHASPPCPNFSTAKANNEEQPEDIALAEAVANWINNKLPTFFTLENVYQYRNSQSWQIIAKSLYTHGYQFNYWHVNMADYGVPQTRKRMIVIARRDGVMPMLPVATHAERPVNGLFGSLQKRVDWYLSIQDLVNSMKRCELTERHNRVDIQSFSHPVLITTQNNRGTNKPQIIERNGKFSLTAQSLHGWRYVNLDKSYMVNPRSFCRFQSFPDWYILPINKSLAFRGIGNAVPPLFIQRLGESLI